MGKYYPFNDTFRQTNSLEKFFYIFGVIAFYHFPQLDLWRNFGLHQNWTISPKLIDFFSEINPRRAPSNNFPTFLRSLKMIYFCKSSQKKFLGGASLITILVMRRDVKVFRKILVWARKIGTRGGDNDVFIKRPIYMEFN